MKTCNALSRIYITCVLCAQAMGITAQSYQKQFAVYRRNKQVGMVVASQSQLAAGAQYIIKAHIGSTVIIPIEVDVVTENHFDLLGKMKIATYKQFATGGFDKTTQTIWKQNTYLLTKDGKVVLRNPQPIFFTASMLYFKEPLAVSHVYSESNLCLIPLLRIAPGVYRMDLPDGNHTTYTYINGMLQTVKATSIMGEVLFKAQNNSSYARQ